MPKQINAAGGCNANITPNDVATPLPPLKPANRGNTCPSITKIAAIIFKLINSLWSITVERNICGRNTANSPFNTSTSNTIIPGFLPKTRNVLVAPAFLLPCSLTSNPKNRLPTHTAVGIEPNTYAKHPKITKCNILETINYY